MTETRGGLRKSIFVNSEGTGSDNSMNHVSNYAVIVVVLGCFLSGQTTGYQVEEFDPNSLIDPGPDWPVIINTGLDVYEIETDESDVEKEVQIINGFRVQVLATRFAEKADSLKSSLSEFIDEQTYVTFEAPNYKVRVGDCTDRKQAEELQEKMQKMGFHSAWIIRERIELEK